MAKALTVSDIDVNAWYATCEYLNNQPRKCAYRVSMQKNDESLRKLMIELDTPLVFYSSGWGWRLRKGWKENLTKIERLQAIEHAEKHGRAIDIWEAKNVE